MLGKDFGESAVVGCLAKVGRNAIIMNFSEVKDEPLSADESEGELSMDGSIEVQINVYSP